MILQEYQLSAKLIHPFRENFRKVMELLIYNVIYILLNGGWFWILGAMIGETMMKFFVSRTMRVSAIGIFLRNLPKNIPLGII